MRIIESFLIMASLAMAIGLCSAKTAQAAQGKIASYQVGEWQVTAIADAEGKFPSSTFIGLTAEMEKQFVANGPVDSQVNVFLLQGPQNCILVDTGYGLEQQRRGRLLETLGELGVNPGRITDILLTHLHGDHMGGLMANGKATFPNAKVWLHKVEHDYWLSQDNLNSVPEGRRWIFKMAAESLAVYPGKVYPLVEGDKIINDISFMPAFGHTPGHTAFVLKSKGKTMYFAGDFAHSTTVQFPNPQVAVVFDSDPDKATAVRMKMLEQFAKDNTPVAGAHLPFPGVGTIAKETQGYSFNPWLPK